MEDFLLLSALLIFLPLQSTNHPSRKADAEPRMLLQPLPIIKDKNPAMSRTSPGKTFQVLISAFMGNKQLVGLLTAGDPSGHPGYSEHCVLLTSQGYCSSPASEFTWHGSTAMPVFAEHWQQPDWDWNGQITSKNAVQEYWDQRDRKAV